MRYPVNYINITQKYHSRHKGVDFGWSQTSLGANQPIYAVADGVVVSVEKQSGGGNVVYIKHNNGMVSAYGHLQNNSIRVKKGVKVALGQHIANMGRTGKVSGNHLHFGLYKANKSYYSNANAVNPLKYLKVYDGQVVSVKTKANYKLKAHVEYTKGIYQCLTNMKLRTGAGTNYKEILVKSTTSLGKSALTSKVPNDHAVFKKGTKFTAKKIVIEKDGSTWAKSPNGYICIADSKNVYCKKVG